MALQGEIFADKVRLIRTRPCLRPLDEGLVRDVGTGGTGGTCPQDSAINIEVPFLFSGIAP